MTKKELVKHYKKQIVLANAELNNPDFSKEGKEKLKVLTLAYHQFVLDLIK